MRKVNQQCDHFCAPLRDAQFESEQSSELSGPILSFESGGRNRSDSRKDGPPAGLCISDSHGSDEGGSCISDSHGSDEGRSAAVIINVQLFSRVLSL